MKILVPVKPVIDANIRIRVKSDESGVVTENMKMAINPFDEIAVEEAVRLKEKNPAIEIILCSIGSQVSQEILRHGLALGGDRACLVETEKELESLAVAKVLKFLVKRENPQVVLMGKQAIDDDNNQTGQMLASLLQWSLGTFISQLTLDGTSVKVAREIDGGLEFLQLKLPAVLTADLRLNTPRYASLPNIMKAKKKPMDIIPIAETGVDIKPRLKVLKVQPPPSRQSGVMVDSVADLVDKLKNEAKVI